MKKLSMEIVNPKAAGIDIGSRFHMVAVNQNVDDVKEFGVYTEEHEAMIIWLKENSITTIAMESTGSYWQTLFSALQRAGFEVILVNGQHTKNLKGRKTDVQDCMWIQKLHSLGLLNGSCLPGEYVERLRTYYNHRQHLIEHCSKYVNKMQKALRLMNIRLDVVLNDITGKSGRAILDAILSGEREPMVLASLANIWVKKSKEEIAKSLHGNWREDLMFELQECLSLYDIYCEKLALCDKEFDKVLQSVKSIDMRLPIAVPSGRVVRDRSKHAPVFNVRELAYMHLGVDLFDIKGVSHNTVLCVVSNMSREEMKKFPTVKNFTSWLRLAPNNKKTGGKIISSRTPKGKNQIALALRQAANSIGNQKDHPLTHFFKRIAYKKGRVAAITATARKLAVIIYHMITKQQAYQPINSEEIITRIKKHQISNIKQRLNKLNLLPDELNDIVRSVSLSAN